MRRAAAFALLLVVAGCKQEPTFDERFDATRKSLEAKAKAIDQELSVAASEGAAVVSTGPGSPGNGE